MYQGRELTYLRKKYPTEIAEYIKLKDAPLTKQDKPTLPSEPIKGTVENWQILRTTYLYDIEGGILLSNFVEGIKEDYALVRKTHTADFDFSNIMLVLDDGRDEYSSCINILYDAGEDDKAFERRHKQWETECIKIKKQIEKVEKAEAKQKADRKRLKELETLFDNALDELYGQ